MKLNNEKNIMLCEKALYSRQLQYYAKLCSLYYELAQLNGTNVTPDNIQDIYSEALSLASKGNLDFLKPENNIIYSNNYTTKKYSDEEVEIFKKYAYCSKRLAQFKEASSILKGSIIRLPQGNTFDLTAINKYKNYMQNTSKSTIQFDNSISEASPRLIGYSSYLITKKSIDKINSIDSSHINSRSFSEALTPSAFGATISGFKTPMNVIDEAYNIYDESEKREYSKEPNLFRECAYVFGQKAVKSAKSTTKKFHTTQKTSMRATFAAIASATALLGSAASLYTLEYLQNSNIYNNLTSESSEYESYISNKTKIELQSIRNKLNSLLDPNCSSITSENVSEIRDDLDNVIDLVMADLSKSAFETANPDCKVTSVETEYDRTTNKFACISAPPNPEHFCKITYTDKNDEEKSIVITDFQAFHPFAENLIHLSYLNEYYLDKAYLKMDKTSQSHLRELLTKYKEILEDTEQLAGTKMVYSDGLMSKPTLTTVIPEKRNNDSKPYTDDEIR